MDYTKSISPFAPSGAMPGNPTTHSPNFPGARTIREGRRMYVGEYLWLTIYTTDTTWSVFAGTLLVTEGAKPEFAGNREMYDAAFALAEEFIKPEPVDTRTDEEWAMDIVTEHAAELTVSKVTILPPTPVWNTLPPVRRVRGSSKGSRGKNSPR